MSFAMKGHSRPKVSEQNVIAELIHEGEHPKELWVALVLMRVMCDQRINLYFGLICA